MWKAGSAALALGFMFAVPAARGDARLTPLEAQWLEGGAPVIHYARLQKLPLDVVVQPTDQPGRAPLAMAFIEGRCKLVFSMRGNPAAETTLNALPPALLRPVIEAVTAHEIGHCWRYVQGAWHTLPAGFVDATPALSGDQQLDAVRRDMRETRREEAFADLVGLAWAYNRYPEHYAAVHAWVTQVRDDGEGNGHHDTGAWVRLVRDPSAFADGATPFAQVTGLWQRGLLLAGETQP
jgi:hypothetical protein